MRKHNAKVSESAVRMFCQTVKGAEEYSPRFDRGIHCLEQLMCQLEIYEKELTNRSESMNGTQIRLEKKIDIIQKTLQEIEKEIIIEEGRLTALEIKCAATPRATLSTGEDGEALISDNSAYEEICEEIELLQERIQELEETKDAHQKRLDKARSIHRELQNCIYSVKEALHTVSAQIELCKQLVRDLEDIKAANQKQSKIAAESLIQILSIIDKYLHIKMRYEMALNAGTGFDFGVYSNNDISNYYPKFGEKAAWQKDINQISEEEIEKHHIKFDESRHIVEYDGKTFGGKYNSYDVRLNRTSFNNPYYGRYEGMRGESMFIPSERTMLGIDVKGILNSFGLNGIVYRNAEPDFEVCAEAVVKIASMTSNRLDYVDKLGCSKLGNFSQADIELARLWNQNEREGRTGWEPRDVLQYRQDNRLTWHEKCDTETMVLVPFKINKFFKHSGGCSECAKRDGAVTDGGGFDE